MLSTATSIGVGPPGPQGWPPQGLMCIQPCYEALASSPPMETQKLELELTGTGWAWDPSAFRQLRAHFLQPGQLPSGASAGPFKSPGTPLPATPGPGLTRSTQFPKMSCRSCRVCVQKREN